NGSRVPVRRDRFVQREEESSSLPILHDSVHLLTDRFNLGKASRQRRNDSPHRRRTEITTRAGNSPRRKILGPGTNATMNDLGLHMPAEWEPPDATWLAWPHEREDWPGKFEAILWVYAEIVRHLHASEPIHLLVNDADAESQARDLLTRAQVDLARIT